MNVYEDIRALVLNMLDCPKPIVSAIEGFCSGAGLAVGIMADISIAARSATFIDTHTIVGLACGDHAALSWPLHDGHGEGEVPPADRNASVRRRGRAIRTRRAQRR